MRHHLPIALLAIVCVCACGEKEAQTDTSPPGPLAIRIVGSPAAQGSGEPNLFVLENGAAYLTWIEPDADAGSALRFSVLNGEAWTAPRTIAQGDDWFVNWADFPSLVVLRDGSLAAHWLAKSGEGTYAYDVMVSRSRDGGNKWYAPMSPHTDGTQTQHGFVSMLPWTGSEVMVVWLDGRNMSGAEGSDDGHGGGGMTLRTATLDAVGGLASEALLDDRACDCCPTSAVLTPEGALVAYRDRSDDEVRDISVVRFDGTGWTAPASVYDDGWKVAGCPVNGPALAVAGNNVACAWFTAANEVSKINVAFSSDGGAMFGTPIRIDDGDPMGRADVVLLDDGSAIVSWLEVIGENAEIRLRKVKPSDGDAGAQLEESFTLSETSQSRASGFPRMVHAGNKIVFAWTQAGDPSTVRTAVAKLSK